jgi:hopene-associated glycosyltransferase HpnB
LPVTATLAIAALGAAIWLYLLLARGGFWYERPRPAPEASAQWPEIAAVVPARNEAEGIGAAIGSLLRQRYPGRFSVVLVDDHSDDGTADLARAAAREAGAAERLTVVEARALPPGWTGKLWAVAEGLRHLEASGSDAELVLLTDADIAHHADNVAELTARMEMSRLELASLMVLLRCESFAERALIPAFVFFFAMLYPFAWVNDRRRATAGAAGGCMLVRRSGLARIGGIESIRGALIDDCALGRKIKAIGPIWLGLTARTRSLRRYDGLGDIWRMIARTAYTQLHHSPILLGLTVISLVVTYLAPPAIALSAGGIAGPVGAMTWLAMSIAFAPILRLYRQPLAMAPLLPLIALFYLAATVDSARRHRLGRGGEWKGRVQQARGPA